jgi:hypothetical protein
MVTQPVNSAACRMPVAPAGAFRYSGIIETTTTDWIAIMGTSLTLRALALLVFVAASTTVILKPAPGGDADGARLQALDKVVVVSQS